ncbi:hypothetical protein BDM02DRAFT_1842057 [Thelephora ganbajun]|uniref:Uncharacterized protein n=1 Tax=Thelephora ganbajun TaxID=370292 RepID=A0ACB6Z181_THEGA|nr:hypothetical protein BDM02DRAFT_1842057 [Thelephora ganbajun]
MARSLMSLLILRKTVRGVVGREKQDAFLRPLSPPSQTRAGCPHDSHARGTVQGTRVILYSISDIPDRSDIDSCQRPEEKKS